MCGDGWFGEGHWSVGVGYDRTGLYIRASNWWDTRSARAGRSEAVRDVAEAARVYAREVHLGVEAQNDAAEIKIACEVSAPEAARARRIK
jgi:hypothetical protein